MCEIDPALKPDDNGVVYLKCIKALYGHIEAARLFYNDLNETIKKKLNFQQNRYHPCVYNKRTQDGIVMNWVLVDDLKISSRSKEQLDWTIKKLKEVYGEITEHHGEEHDYLGMILTYELEKKRIILNMKKMSYLL
jgi:hypothetical protein